MAERYALPCRGFTLIEVVVAFAVLSLALAALYRVFALSAHQVQRIEQYGEALALAELKLTEAERSLAAGRGETREGFSWERRVEPFIAPPPDASGQPGIAPYRITVEVRWERAGRRQQVLLETVRLGGRS